jgi:hypothetical protein
VALFDYPTSAVLRPEGIERRSVLRRAVLPWRDVRELRRLPSSRLRRSAPSLDPLTTHEAREGRESPDAAGRGARRGRVPRPGGLVAVRGRRRVLVTDQPESPGEFDAIVAAVARWAPHVEITAARPPDGVVPTWLYRPRRWRSGAR